MNIWNWNFKTSSWALFYAKANTEILKAALEMNPHYLLVYSDKIPAHINFVFA